MDELIRNEYSNIVKKMLSLGIIRMSDIYPKVRIINPEFYSIALALSNKTSKKDFVEDLSLLCQDIDKCKEFLSEYDLFEGKLKTLEDIFYHFISNNQYKDDNDVVLFRKFFKK